MNFFEEDSLNQLRSTLIRLEDTIVFSLIERAQYAHNKIIYPPNRIQDCFPLKESIETEYGFCLYFMSELEKVYARMRRYKSPDEHAFTKEGELEQSLIQDLEYPPFLLNQHKQVNWNEKILDIYLNEILLMIVSKDSDDGQYGSSSMRDFECLSALSKRIHYGKFIAEAKYQKQPKEYQALIDQKNTEKIMELLTDETVEQKLLQRVYRKAQIYGQDLNVLETQKYKVEPEKVVKIYKDFIIPLTKQVEVAYLMLRKKELE